MFDMISLAEADLSTLSRDESLARIRELGLHSWRLVAVRAGLDAELDRRGVAYELSYTSTGALLCDVLWLAPGEARARMRLAGDITPRRSLIGPLLDPTYSLVAAAVSDGAISARHADVITRALDAIPDDVRDTDLTGQAEPVLVEHARTLNPIQLARVADRLLDCLDPDGHLEQERRHERRRDVTLNVARDGSGRLSGILTAQR